MMKKFLILAAAVLLAASCKQKPEVPKLDPAGIWELTSVETKVSVGGESVSVYLDFDAQGSFVLYQKIGAGRFNRFEGSWTADQELRQLSGTYTGGAAWGPYDCTCADGILTLALPGGSETDTYSRIDSLPESVTSNIYP